MKQIAVTSRLYLCILAAFCLWVGSQRTVDATIECGADCAQTSPDSYGMRGIAAFNHDSSTIAAVGTNLTPVSDWSPEYPFIDAFKTSRGWITQSSLKWDTEEEDQLDLDENGWVRSLPAEGSGLDYQTVGTLMFSQLGTNYPEGDYTVVYDGEGVLAYGLDATKDVSRSVPGRDVIHVTPGVSGNGIHLKIMETNPDNYIRNIRVVMPGFDPSILETQTFHPDFLNSIRPYGTLRFMDWQRTNWSLAGEVIVATDSPETVGSDDMTIRHPTDGTIDPSLRTGDWSQFEGWAGRAASDSARYSLETGVPLELMVELANLNNANPWFSVPHLADNNYVWNMATLVHEQLSTERYVYVEYTNEAWNTVFGQGEWIEQQGLAEWGAEKDEHLARWHWYGKRSTEVCDIWKQTWGLDAHRVICVLATQSVNPDVGRQMLDCDLHHRPCHTRIDAIAIAPYFGQHLGHPDYQWEVNAWTDEGDGGLNSLFRELNEGVGLPNKTSKVHVDDAIEDIVAYKAVADAYGLMLVAYEGGQHLAPIGAVQNRAEIIELFRRANGDLRMGAIYDRYLAAWRETGATNFVHYYNTGNWDRWGAWGAQQFYNDPNGVKREALLNYAAHTPCYWIGCVTDLVPTAWLPILLRP